MPNDKITKEDVEIMDRYMLRTWVELSIALAQFQQRSGTRIGRSRRAPLTSRYHFHARPRHDADAA